MNIGKNPTGDTIGVPNNLVSTTPAANGIYVGAADQVFADLDVKFWPGAGSVTSVANTRYYRVSCDYNTYDGFDQA